MLIANGTYTYTLNNSNTTVQGLSPNQTLTETFSYTTTDGTATSASTLSITIFGTNDGVIINGLDVNGGEIIVDEMNLSDGSAPNAGF